MLKVLCDVCEAPVVNPQSAGAFVFEQREYHLCNTHAIMARDDIKKEHESLKSKSLAQGKVSKS